MNFLTNANKKKRQIEAYYFALFIYVIILFSPAVSFFLSLIYILKYRKLEYLVAPCAILSLSLIASSRKIYGTFKDDFETYFENYIRLVSDEKGALFDFGVELGLPIINWLLSLAFAELTPRLYLFFIVLIQISLIYIALKRVIRTNFHVALFFVLSMLPLLAPTLFVRQSFSIVLMLFLFDDKKSVRYLVGTISASLFHFAAIPTILFFHFVKGKLTSWGNFKLVTITLCCLASLLLTYQFFSTLPKVRAWFILTGEFQLKTFISNYKIIFAILFLGILIPKKSKNVILLLKSISLILLLALALDTILPFISFRVFLFAIVLSGLGFHLIYVECSDKNIKKIIFSLFIVLASARWVTIFLTPEQYEFVLFYKQDVASTEPLHYIESLYEKDFNKYRRKL